MPSACEKEHQGAKGQIFNAIAGIPYGEEVRLMLRPKTCGCEIIITGTADYGEYDLHVTHLKATRP